MSGKIVHVTFESSNLSEGNITQSTLTHFKQPIVAKYLKKTRCSGSMCYICKYCNTVKCWVDYESSLYLWYEVG